LSDLTSASTSTPCRLLSLADWGVRLGGANYMRSTAPTCRPPRAARGSVSMTTCGAGSSLRAFPHAELWKDQRNRSRTADRGRSLVL